MQKTTAMEVGDSVLISPEVTHSQDWVFGEVIDVENNSFVGKVVSAKTKDGLIYFAQESLFKLQAPCMR